MIGNGAGAKVPDVALCILVNDIVLNDGIASACRVADVDAPHPPVGVHVVVEYACIGGSVADRDAGLILPHKIIVNRIVSTDVNADPDTATTDSSVIVEPAVAHGIVTGIDPKALAPPGVQSTESDPAQPYLTSQVPCGPALDVVPTVGGDGYTIRLAALPQVTEFLRYDTTLDGAKETRVWVDGRQQQLPLPRPITRRRSMHAAVDVYDGQTLVLANPQVTAVSKQPTGESVTNAVPEDAGKRLLAFITATIIDPAGNPIHIPGKEPLPADKPPPQQAQ